MTDNTENVKNNKSFRNSVKPIWCPGCGDHAVLNTLVKSLEALDLNTEDVAVVTGIGCSSRLPGYLSCFGFNSIHGRALPIATGLKLARPGITVVAAGGDGDGFAIGGNHVMHAARRNIDITYLLMDNGIYGLTKGQVSPTTPIGMKTKTTFYGAYEKPINPVEVMLAYGTTFVAQAYAGDPKHLTTIITEAIKYPGFSYVNIISPCITYCGGKELYKSIKDRVHYIDPEKHDTSDWDAAHAFSRDTEHINVGIFYKERRVTYLETQEELRGRAPHGEAANVDNIADVYR